MSCCDTQGGACSRESLFRTRLQQFLRCMTGQFPTLFVRADFWRQMVVSTDPTKYADEQAMVWVRLWEKESVFFMEIKERFYQESVGVINQRIKYLICDDTLHLTPGDHAVINGESYKITEREAVGGIVKMKVEQQKSDFIAPARDLPTYRIFGMRASVA